MPRFELGEAATSGKVLFALEGARVKKSVTWTLFRRTRSKFKYGHLQRRKNQVLKHDQYNPKLMNKKLKEYFNGAG